MTLIRLRRLSLREAEEAIVTLWTCLEEYGIPTPHIDFRFEASGRATLSLCTDPEWHHIVKRRIASSTGCNCQDAAQRCGCRMEPSRTLRRSIYQI